MGSEMPPDSLVGEESSAAAPAVPPPANAANPSPYVILCDAGSTGTRLYVYSLPPFGQHTSSNPTDLPYNMHAVQIQEGPKIKPGLSAQTPETTPTYLLPAFEAAPAGGPLRERAYLCPRPAAAVAGRVDKTRRRSA